MIPGEYFVESGEIVLNADRPVQVGSHFHFYEVNEALEFERELARGQRLDIPAGTAVRFEPGDQKEIVLVPFVGLREIYGFNAKIEGKLDGHSIVRE